LQEAAQSQLVIQPLMGTQGKMIAVNVDIRAAIA
jgi:hypothetical protein